MGRIDRQIVVQTTPTEVPFSASLISAIIISNPHTSTAAVCKVSVVPDETVQGSGSDDHLIWSVEVAAKTTEILQFQHMQLTLNSDQKMMAEATGTTPTLSLLVNG